MTIRKWERSGNRSYSKPAAPHGAYRGLGYERWIAIAAFTELQWLDLLTVLPPRIFNHCRADPDNELHGPDGVLRFGRPLYCDALPETRWPIADGSTSRSGKDGLVRAEPTWAAVVAVARPHAALRAQFHVARTLLEGCLPFGITQRSWCREPANGSPSGHLRTKARLPLSEWANGA